MLASRVRMKYNNESAFTFMTTYSDKILKVGKEKYISFQVGWPIKLQTT